MAKKALLTVDGVHRKVKKGFITDDASIHRKIKKAFMTVGGVYRPCWSGGELEYYGTITGLSRARYKLSATNAGDFAIFCGGDDGDYTDIVDAYSPTLTRSTRYGHVASLPAAASFNGKAYFAGGRKGSSSCANSVYAIDESLTGTYPFTLYYSREEFAGAVVGDYLIFGSGSSYSSNGYNTWDFYSSAGTHTYERLGDTYDWCGYGAASVADYAIFAGGGKTSVSAALTQAVAYNASLTRSNIASLSSARWPAGVSLGGYAIFAGGGPHNMSNSAVIDAYDNSLTRIKPANFSTARRMHGSTTLMGEYALFGGGSGPLASVEAYDTSLTRTNPTDLSVARYGLAAASAGNYAIFAGGYYGFNECADAEAYTIA